MEKSKKRDKRMHDPKNLSPHNALAELLSSKLTKEEFNQLADMIDSDPPAGPFWEAIQSKNCELSPELYASDDQIEKEEVRNSLDK